MPTRNISLTAEQDQFVEDIVSSGEYQNASEAVRDALRVLRQRREEDALRLKAMRKLVAAGAADLDAGRYREIDTADLGAYFRDLASARGS